MFANHEKSMTRSSSVDTSKSTFTPQERLDFDAQLWRKLDRWILPTVTIYYLLSFLDRANVSNAKVAGMTKDLGISPYQYSIALTVTFVPYIASELPSNLVLKRIGPNYMLPAMVTLFGMVTLLQGFVKNYAGLLCCRFFLGLLEGGLFPGLVLYLSFFYPRQRLQIRISTFFASASLSGAFSGLLAAAIVKMDQVGGRRGWQWIFILEGGFTVVFGIISFFILPRSVSHSRFLSEREKEYINDVLHEEGLQSANPEEHKAKMDWSEVTRVLRMPHVWLVGVAFFFCGTTLYGLAYFVPTIVSGLGNYSAVKVQLMSVPPFALAFLANLVTAWISDKYQCRGLVSIAVSSLCLIGFAMFLASESKPVQYASLFFSLTGTYCAAPALATWTANNATPEITRGTAIAIGFIFSNLGGILSVWLFGFISPAPKYATATIINITFSSGAIILPAITLWYLKNENQKKAERRAALGSRAEEPAGLGHKSAWFIYKL